MRVEVTATFAADKSSSGYVPRVVRKRVARVESLAEGAALAGRTDKLAIEGVGPFLFCCEDACMPFDSCQCNFRVQFDVRHDYESSTLVGASQ